MFISHQNNVCEIATSQKMIENDLETPGILHLKSHNIFQRARGKKTFRSKKKIKIISKYTKKKEKFIIILQGHR